MMNRDDILIEVDQLMSKLDDGNLRIYDASMMFFRQESDPTAYEEYVRGCIPNAAFFDHEVFSDPAAKYGYTVLPEPALFDQIGKIGIGAESEVVLYGNFLPSATRAWWILHYAGHDHVRILNGGLTAWRRAGGPVGQGEHRYEPTTFKADLRSGVFASKEEVLAALEDSDSCVVNTLNIAMYEQARIAGSSLQSALELMQDMESFRPDDVLAARLEKEAQHRRIITYCGGGIAATVNAVAHLMASNKNVAVYDGSMNEWLGEGLPTLKGKSKNT